jgi:hypothetical protein
MENLQAYVRGVAGAVVGGILGFFTFRLLLQMGLSALAAPGEFLGMGCSYLSRIRSWPLGIFCGIAALGLGIFSEWNSAPFLEDDSFGFFLRNLGGLGGGTKLMILLGTALGGWFGLGSPSFTQSQHTASHT